MIAFIGALMQEMAGVSSRMRIDHVDRHDGCLCYHGWYGEKPVVLALSGMGRERAERAAELVLGTCRIEALVSVGFGGGLTPDLRIGDVVICSELRGAGGGVARSDARLVSLASRKGILVGRDRVGKGITTLGVVSGAEEKKKLARDYGVDIVDMESYWLAARAAARGVPFLGARAVSDTLEEPVVLPGGAINADGRLRVPQAFSLLSRPRSLAQLPRLFSNARRARRSITGFVDRLVTSL